MHNRGPEWRREKAGPQGPATGIQGGAALPCPLKGKRKGLPVSPVRSRIPGSMFGLPLKRFSTRSSWTGGRR